MYTRVTLRKPVCCTQIVMYNTHVFPKYVTIYIATHAYLLAFKWLLSLQPVYASWKCQNKYVFLNSGSLGSYATDSFSCNYFVFEPIYSERYKYR